MNTLLLCTDMDRTVIPNGMQPESETARQEFTAFCNLPEVTLSYVTGRHLQLMNEAIIEFGLPQPDYAITDVGTRIYHFHHNQWQALNEWETEIDIDWKGVNSQNIIQVLEQIDGLSLQEPEKQNEHKISFYVDLQKMDERACLSAVEQKIAPLNVAKNLIWSIDETTDTGLLDILPPRANKLHAIQFLQAYLGMEDKDVVFAGDSGNDLPVLISSVQSVLVANATEALKQQAQSLAKQANQQACFYQATNRTDELLDGNYSAGVLQGVFYYRPDLQGLTGQ